MPNINEFFSKPELVKKENLETIHGVKPCSKCDKNAEEAFWDPDSMTLAWECPDGHSNQVEVG
jgi:hypothetical protein